MQPVEHTADLDQGRQYLELLFEDVPGLIEIRSLPPKQGPAGRSFHGSVGGAISAVQEYAADGQNVYVGVATRRDGSGGGKQNLQATRAIFVDVDFKAEGDREVLEVALENLPVPSLRVFTGGGQHVYWILEEWVDLASESDVQHFESVLKGLTDLIGGDRAATDASRILRVPGTVNFPDARKRARGRVPACSTIIEDSGKLYAFSDFDDYALRGAALPQNGRVLKYEAVSWDGTIPEKVQKLLNQDKELQARFDRTPGTHADQSASGIDASLAAMLAKRGLRGGEVEAALRASRDKAGLPPQRDDYYRRTVERELSWIGNQSTDAIAQFKTTDLANAQRIARSFGDSLRWVRGIDFLVWEGTHWEASETRALRLASSLGRLIHEEAAEVERQAAQTADSEKRERLAKLGKDLVNWARVSEAEGKIRAALNLARPHLETPVDKLDADPWVLNALNGTIDLRTAMLRPHRREDLLTKVAPVEYDRNAKSELWGRFLERAIPDPDARWFFQKAAGYSLPGVTGEDVLLVVHGPPRTGKGTSQDALASALGDYALTAGLDDFGERDRSGGPRPDLVRLRGARMVSVYETSARFRLSAALIKTLCGSDPVTARAMYREPVTFLPQCTFWIATNHRPRVPNDDEALWERIRELPFETVIPPDERDPAVRDQLRDPERCGSAVLAWAVEGCLGWQREGLKPPEVVRNATQDYRDEMDPLASFLKDCCCLSADTDVLANDLREAYEQYARENGERPIGGGKRWGTALRKLGCEPGRNPAGRRIWTGVRLLAPGELTG